jgi:FAD/FMN-containing dehydrogenase
VSSYWSLIAQLRPKCILQPTSAEDVALAVTTLVNTNAKTPQNCQFAVRGGGHTTWAGAANIVDGVTIDLSLMNSTTYDDENSLALIGSGARWGSVYMTLDELGISISGGRASTVGVAGLALGGRANFKISTRGYLLIFVRRQFVLCCSVRSCL